MYSYDHHYRVDDHYIMLMSFINISYLLCLHDKVKAHRVNTAFITVIIIIACITSTVIFHHSSALISAYIIIAIMKSNTLYATYYPLSTYYNFPPHLMPIPLHLFDCMYICMYVDMYVSIYLCIDGDNNDVIVMMIYYVLE